MAEVRDKIGIPGMDKVMKGKGIKVPHSILVTGSPGVGKTVFALQFIYDGAKKGIPGLFIAYEEKPERLKQFAMGLGMNKFDEFEKKGLITFIEQPASAGKITSIRAPYSIIKSKGIKRVVLDSLTLFEFIYSKDPMSFRKGVMDFVTYMKEAGVLLVGTAERSTSGVDTFQYDIQDYLFDGIILLFTIRKGSSFERCFSVLKMRGHDHLIDIFPFAIQKGGIEIYTEQLPFSLMEKA